MKEKLKIELPDWPAFIDVTKLSDYETGHINTDEWILNVIKISNADVPFGEFRQCLRKIYYDCIRLDEDMFAMLHRTRNILGHIAVLSDTNPMCVEFVRKKYPGFYFSFQSTFFSYELGMKKNCAEIYQKVTKLLRADYDSLVLIDDRKANTELAEKQNWKGIHYDKNQPDAIEKVETQLLGFFK